MGQQQMLLIIVGVIIVGISIAVGIVLFGADSVSSNRDALVNDLNNISANAYQYRTRIISMGGGGGKYTNYTIPVKMRTNDDGIFTVVVQPQTLTFTGTSALGFGTVEATLDSTGALGNFTYTGDFL